MRVRNQLGWLPRFSSDGNAFYLKSTTAITAAIDFGVDITAGACCLTFQVDQAQTSGFSLFAGAKGES